MLRHRGRNGTNLLFDLGLRPLSRLYGPEHCLSAAGACGSRRRLMLIRMLANSAGARRQLDIVKSITEPVSGRSGAITAFLVAITSRDFFAFGNALIILAGWGMLVTWLLATFATIWVAYILMAAPAILRAGRTVDGVVAPRAALTDI